MTQADRVLSTPPTNTPISQGDTTSRRRFLSQAAGVATGGAVLALATIPTALAVAAPANPLGPVFSLTDRRALEAYASWLFMERRILCGELWPHMGAQAERWDWQDNAGAGWHFRGDWKDLPQPSARASAVLDLVGVDWRQPKPDMGLDHDDSGKRPAMPPNWPQIDGDLSQALKDLELIEAAQNSLISTFGDDAAERDDYTKLEERRNDCIAVLVTVPAMSMAGVQAKASALRLKVMIEDHGQHQQIAVSLADDLIALGPVANPGMV
jgi:hypothetical protein